MFSFEVGLVDSGINKGLEDLKKKLTYLNPVLIEIGKLYNENTKLRFKAKQSPTGKQWSRNTLTTQRLKEKGYKGRAKGIEGGYSMGVWSGNLQNSIGFKVYPGNNLSIGVYSNQKAAKYAQTFQQGAKRHSFTKGNGAQLTPWGDIPGRPFLGFNKVTNSKVMKLLKEYLSTP